MWNETRPEGQASLACERRTDGSARWATWQSTTRVWAVGGKKAQWVVVIATLWVLLGSGAFSAPARSVGAAGDMLEAALAEMPLVFVENVGQFDPEARFQLLGSDGTLWLAQEALWITVVEPAAPAEPAEGMAHRAHPPTVEEARQGVALRLSFPGANPQAQLEPFDRLSTEVNYLLGNDPDAWRTGVPAWGGVRYVDLYPGIDLELTGRGGQLQPRLVVREEASLAAVRLHAAGGSGLEVVGNQLHIGTAAGTVRVPLLRVVAANARAHPLPATAHLRGATLSAPFAAPAAAGEAASLASGGLDYSTFLGGSNYDEGHGIAVDAAGNVYVTGETLSGDYPTTPGAYDTSDNGLTEAFVSKLDATGSNLLYSTFLGGHNYDRGHAIAVDGAGNAYVTGETPSGDYPTTAGAYDTSHNSDMGINDVFVSKLDATGSNLLYSTFLGGSSYEEGYGIAVDGAGNAYVTGYTESIDYPATPGAYDTSFNGSDDVFVSKLNATGSSLLYSMFLGGSSDDEGHVITVDGAGNAYVTGDTGSSTYPATAAAYDTSFDGSLDVFVSKLNGTGSSLLYSTFLGSSGTDYGRGIALDGAGNVYVTGSTGASTYPTTAGAYDTSHNGYYDVFVSKLNATGSSLLYSTFLGGSSWAGLGDGGYGIALDGAGNVYVTGYTDASDYPTTSSAYDLSYNGGSDVFVSKLDATGSSLLYSTFLGGTSDDNVYGIAVDGADNAYVTGYTESTDYPTTSGAYDTSYNGGINDVFVSKLHVTASTPTATSTPTSTPTSATPHPTITPSSTPPSFTEQLFLPLTVEMR